MKKMFAALLCCALVLLAGCTSGLTIEDMLTAPALTADQSAVLEALNVYTEEKTVLKYPATGDRRAPIQFVDLDADGTNEAVVFFSIPTEDVYAMLAVFKKYESGWQISGVQQGAGTDVESISIIRLEDEDGRFLLVEWSNTNSRGNQLTAYHFEDNQITQGFEDTVSDILVYDLDQDGLKEFCYITPAGGAAEPLTLKYVDNSGSSLALTGECELSEDALSSANICAGTLEDGRKAVFVDEMIGDSMKITEVFVLNGSMLAPVQLADGYELPEISRRSAEMLDCRAVFGGYHVYIPSEQPPYADVYQPLSWTYWYTIQDQEVVYAGASYVDDQYNIAMMIPDGWLSGVVVASGVQLEPRMIELYDMVNEAVLVRLKILEIGEDAAGYIQNGFQLITQSGSYRYYIQANCTEAEINYIKNNFAIL